MAEGRSSKTHQEAPPYYFATCDWGYCDAPIVAFRLDPESKCWLCVCQEHASEQGAITRPLDFTD